MVNYGSFINLYCRTMKYQLWIHPRVKLIPYPATKLLRYTYTHKWNYSSIRCSWSIVYRRCPHYIFILDFTPGFDGLVKANCKTRRETFKFWNLMRLLIEMWRYVIKHTVTMHQYLSWQFSYLANMLTGYGYTIPCTSNATYVDIHIPRSTANTYIYCILVSFYLHSTASYLVCSYCCW